MWVAVGAVGALELDRWLTRQRERLAQTSFTEKLLDGVNRRLERGRAR